MGPELQLVYCKAGQEQEQEQELAREQHKYKGHEKLGRLKGDGSDEYSFLVDHVGIFSTTLNLKVDKC